MTTATDGILAYGYNLGGDDWELADLTEYGELITAWWNDEDQDDDAHFPTELITALGNPDDGTEVITYQSESHPKYLLAAKQTTVARGHIETITPETLGTSEERAQWDAQLKKHLATLGITPLQGHAAWLLVSYWEI